MSVNQEVQGINKEEMRAAMKKMKNGEEVGLFGIPVDV